uniref:DNA polymerase III, delta subunit n=1 Tax=Megaviridae environmental sample TaxID=1737588 RepID=A0A5J6VL68_9VIRU|nr:MAG: DNA polymerase III, delta subunit [Megaviridae environmental sample]
MNTLWIEKYRPVYIEEIIGQNNIIELIKKMSKFNYIPNMLFYGKPGTGKTSVINTIIKNYYNKNNIFTIMKLDASDDRGINTVRDEIKGFAEKRSLFPNKYKLIILDEADSMTFDAQSALKRIIEKNSKTTKFCFICNYENKIISSIKNRCVNFKFKTISENNVIKKLYEIVKIEKIDISKNALKVIAYNCCGDLRKAINILQSLNYQSKNINIFDIYKILGVPNVTTVEMILDKLIENKISLNQMYDIIKKNIIDKGYSLSLYLKETLKLFVKKIFDLPEHIICYYFSELADLEIKVSKSTFGDLYILNFVCIFKKIEI